MKRKQRKFDKSETTKDIHDEIESCFYFPNKLLYIYGLQKLRISTNEKTIEFMPLPYKIFSLFILIILATLMTLSVFSLIADLTTSENILFIISIPSSFAFLGIFHSVTIVHNQFFAPKTYKKMLNCLIEINEKFRMLKCPTSTSFKKPIIFLITIQFLSKLINFVSTVMGPMIWTMWVHLFSSIVVDTEMLLMLCNIEVAAKSFEILNKRLSYLECIDSDLKQCLVNKMWNINCDKIEMIFMEDDIDACLSILNHLTQYLENANICYRPTV